MEIKIECPWCNQHYSVDESFVGQTVECSVCEKEFVVRKPNNPVTVAKTKTVDAYIKNKKTNKPSVSANQNSKKRISLSKVIIKRGIIAFAVLVTLLIALALFYCTILIPEKEYKSGLKAYAEQRHEEAVALFQKAAEHGHKKAKAEINYINGNNAYNEQRFEDAIEFYKKATELGHSKANKDQQKALSEINYINGKRAFNGHRYEEAVDLFQKAADLGHSEAQLMLGMCYFNGDGIKRDYDEAVKWFRRAAEQKNRQAQFKLGMCYLAGIGVNPRDEEALYWLKQAAENGLFEAQIELGDFYYKDSKNQDFSQALVWYQKAGRLGKSSRAKEIEICQHFIKAYEGDAEMQYLIFSLYSEGKDGITKNDNEALKWLLASANSGYTKAETKLYYVYKEGLYSAPKSFIKAEQWLRKAADHDDADALCELGSNVLLGREGFKRDFKEGRKWLRKAVIQMSVEANLLLRFLYVQEPTPMNNFFRKENINKYRTEAENGDTNSMELIGDCYLLGIGVEQDIQKALDWYKKCDAI
jgi:TPR repeat protein